MDYVQHWNLLVSDSGVRINVLKENRSAYALPNLLETDTLDMIDWD